MIIKANELLLRNYLNRFLLQFDQVPLRIDQQLNSLLPWLYNPQVDIRTTVDVQQRMNESILLMEDKIACFDAQLNFQLHRVTGRCGVCVNNRCCCGRGSLLLAASSVQ